MRDKLAAIICEMWTDAEAARTDQVSQWETVARYVLPRKASFYEDIRTPGGQNHRRERMVLDSTAPRALEQFASFLHTSLANPTIKWFWLQLLDEAQRDPSHAVKSWLERSRASMAMHIETGRSNAYAAMHELYLDLGAFGTAVMFVEWDRRRASLHFQTEHLADTQMWEGADGRIDMLARRRFFSFRQAKQQWPNADLGASFEVGEDGKPKKKSQDKVPFVQLVFPKSEEWLVREVDRPYRDADNYLSVWVNMDDKKVVDVGTYRDKPFMVPRWVKQRGEVYGRSPAMTVMGDILMVNRMAETVLRGAEKLVDPPLVIPDGGMLSPIRLFPGGITYSDGEVTPQPLLPPGASRIELGSALIAERQGSIRDGFFVPLFITPDSPVKTATQVLQEVDERNKQVAPMLLRMQHELFDPLIVRVFDVLGANGQIPTAPQDIPNAGLKVSYVSPIVSSQEQSSALAIMRWLEQLSFLAQFDPGAADHIEVDEAAVILHKGSGSSQQVIKPASQLKRVRDQREQQEAAQAQQQQLTGGVEAAAKLAAATRPRA